MNKLQQFAGYRPVQSSHRAQLPIGGYVAMIIDAHMEPLRSGQGQRMVFRLEIAEGEYEGFYTLDYEAQQGGKYEARFRGTYSILYPTGDGSERDGYAVSRFNRVMGAIESSNPDYHWDWQLNSLKGRTMGIIVRESEYNDNVYTEIGMLIDADAVRTGRYRLMPRRVPRNESFASPVSTIPTIDKPADPGFTVVTDDSDIPF